jgi:hypothetical protein
VYNVAAVGGAVNRCQSSLNDSGNVPGGPEIVVAARRLPRPPEAAGDR